MKKALIITTALFLIISSTAFAFASDVDMPNSNIEPIGGYPNPYMDYNVYTGGWILDYTSREDSYIRTFYRTTDDNLTYVYSSLLTFDPYNYFAMQALASQFDIANIYLRSISDNILTFKNSNHSDLDKIYNRQAVINSSINNLTSSLDNINWLTKSDSGVILRDKNYNTISSAGSYYPMYFTFTNLYEYPCIYRFHIYYTENYGNTKLNLMLGTYANGQFNPMLPENIFYTYCASTLGYDVYVFSTGFAYTNQSINALTIKVDNGYLYNTNVVQRYIPFGTKDFNDTLIAMTNLSLDKSSKHIDSDFHHQNDILDIFKSLYASDDLIAAKQAQQSVEDASISNFTGSGSGAASVSDVNATKNAQKAVKDSLNTGASASNVSNIVGVNSGFFSFFSQSISDSVNNPSLSRQTRDINNPDYVPDFLSQNEREYWRLINGDNR